MKIYPWPKEAVHVVEYLNIFVQEMRTLKTLVKQGYFDI
jgi:hypothetical protein